MSQIPTEEDRPYWCESSTIDSSLYRVGGLVIPLWDAWDWYERVREQPLTTERDIRFFWSVMRGLSRHLDRVVEDWPKERYVAFTAYGGNLSQGPENCFLATQAIGMPESCRNLKEEEIPQFEAGEKEDHFRQYLAEQGEYQHDTMPHWLYQLHTL